MNHNKTCRLNFVMAILIALLIFHFCGIEISAQNKEEKAVNLKVLPADISAKDLDRKMDDFSRALGVHCNFCHSNPDDKTLKKNDFAADWNPNKLVARSMIRMESTINNDLLKDARKFNKDIGEVTCISCHHGSSSVILLEDQLFETYQKNGIDASLKEYENLKKQYYGSFTYDFSNRSLLNFASLLSSSGKSDDAVTVAKKNSELFPEAVVSYLFLGNEYAKKGNKDEAIKHFRKALQIEPNNRYATQQLKKLQQ